MPEAEQARPSYGRWFVLGLICLMYLITYLDRVNISTAAPEISKEFGFDKITMGWIFSAFVWAYALFQVPGGWLSDRFGARPVLATIVAYWSVMTAATALASGAISFFFVRFLFGAGEAGAFPGATRAMQVWYPRRERGLVQGLTHSASRLGAAIAPPIVVLIMSALGWRSVFYICGGEFEKINLYTGLAFGGAFLCVALFYGLLWVLAGSETAGQRWTNLRLINFDGSPIDRRERGIRFAAACLSLCSVGLGLLWSLADEESLTWHDHMSKTFPTIRV